jgi:hypothetical protein
LKCWVLSFAICIVVATILVWEQNRTCVKFAGPWIHMQANLFKSGDGGIVASNDRTDLFGPEYLGYFQFQVPAEHRGPWLGGVTSIKYGALSLSLTEYDGFNFRTLVNTQIPSDSAYRTAIQHYVDKNGTDIERSAWHGTLNPIEQRVGQSILSIALLAFLLHSFINIFLITPRIVRDFRSRRWLRRGACGNCGYDRRGLEPSAACPECGQLVM